jgi:hypothetical protein
MSLPWAFGGGGGFGGSNDDFKVQSRAYGDFQERP